MVKDLQDHDRGGKRNTERDAAQDPDRKRTPKHQVVFEYLHGRISSGEYKPGDRLPSEAELCNLFGASRITAAKAVLELQRLGLVTRRPGAGTHVKLQPQLEGRTFGLLIPELGLTEIFEPVCHGMARSSFARPHTLVWGSASGSDGAGSHRESAELAEQMAHRFIAQSVAGVFFAPLELISESEAANRRIARWLERARIPIVLLDRCYLPYPERSLHDLVGIDNRCTGYKITDHLLRLGVTRLAFLGEEYAAQTVDARLTGFFEALRLHGIHPDGQWAWRGSPMDRSFVAAMMEGCRPQGVVCANDVTAARLMQTLLALGYEIPEDIRIVGIDDVKYASLLPVPLTTIHQNCAALGMVAMATMLERVAHPELPVRDVLVPTKLVVRSSCGAQLSGTAIGR